LSVAPNETVVPLLQCAFPEETVEFWKALGFEVTYEQRKPYLYLAFHWSGFDLHYGRAADGIDPAAENTGGCLVLVDSVAAYHAVFAAALREKHGKVLAKGLPRITRFRPGASRFTVLDPSGNSIVFIQRDAKEEVEYGGSAALSGLAKVLDNARILLEFKTDPQAAYRALNSGLRRHGDTATALERGKALAVLVELAESVDQQDRVPEWGAALTALSLTAEERDQVMASVADPAVLAPWLGTD
jgi:catechol 2,3-dioxygenase-like lactoylglutathione lyase family enzyme